MASRTGFNAMRQRGPVTSWSYSRYSDYKKCPALFGYKHVDRMKEPPNKAMDRGIRIHKLAEEYTLGKLAEFPKELGDFKSEFDELRTQNPEVELTITFTKDWEEQTTFDDWNRAWVRIKADAKAKVGNKLRIIDNKTGKIYDSHKEQLELYAVAGFLLDGDVEIVAGEMWYLDQGELVPFEWERKSLKHLISDWNRKIKAMMSDTMFAPTPGGHCNWCHFRKENGGPCQY